MGSGEVAVFVIDPPSVGRGYGLVEQLEGLGLGWVIRTGFGPEVVDQSEIGSRVDQRGAHLHSGGPLTREQIACFASHEEAICQKLNPTDSAWRVILEEDAAVDERFAEFIEDLSILNFARPTIVALFSLGRVVKSRQLRREIRAGGSSLERLVVPPASAVAYAINAAATEVVRRHRHWPIFTRSDWPVWSAEMDFYIANPFVVGHVQGPSTMSGVTASPEGLVRAGRMIRKAVGGPFLLHSSSYGGSVRRYWRHALMPSIVYGAASLESRLRRVIVFKSSWRS